LNKELNAKEAMLNEAFKRFQRLPPLPMLEVKGTAGCVAGESGPPASVILSIDRALKDRNANLVTGCLSGQQRMVEPHLEDATNCAPWLRQVPI